VSDGEDHEGEAISIAQRATKTGIVINSLGLGSISGSLIPISNDGVIKEYKKDKKGNLVTTTLNEEMLVELAEAGNGVFIRIDNQSSNGENLNDVIDNMEKKSIEVHEYAEFEDRYQIFAVFSLIFAVIAFIIPTYRKKVE
jgi:Ca-activated chloride channel family protein